MPLKFDLKKLELGKLNPGLNREQLIALGVTALIVVFCVTVVTWSLGVRSEARAELVEKLDALALLEARVGGGAKARGPVRNPAAPASAFLTTQTQGLAGAELGEAFRAAGTTIAMLCSSPKGYEAGAAAAVETLRDAGAATVLLAGRAAEAGDATVRVGGHAIDRPGAYMEPTLLTDVDHISQSMDYDEMLSWLLFYTSLFALDRIPQLAIADPAGLVIGDLHGRSAAPAQ